MTFDKYYILDTNILLEDAGNIYKLSQESKNLIILPETVLDEIDSKKSGFDEINFQAREFARILENSTVIKNEKIEDYKIITVQINDKHETQIDIISKENYDVNIKNVPINIINDRKILEIAKFANTYYAKEIEFLSLDIMARTRAISLDIKTDALVGSSKEEFNYEFIKEITINFDELEFLDNQEIIKYDKEYKPYNC